MCIKVGWRNNPILWCTVEKTSKKLLVSYNLVAYVIVTTNCLVYIYIYICIYIYIITIRGKRKILLLFYREQRLIMGKLMKRGTRTRKQQQNFLPKNGRFSNSYESILFYSYAPTVSMDKTNLNSLNFTPFKGTVQWQSCSQKVCLFHPHAR